MSQILRLLIAFFVFTFTGAYLPAFAAGAESSRFDPGGIKAGISTEWVPSVPVRDQPAGASSEVNVGFTRLTQRMDFPPMVRAQGRLFFSQGIEYEYLAVQFENWTAVSPAPPPDRLHALAYRLLFVRRLSEKWKMVTIGKLGVHSDFYGLSTEDIRLQGGLFFTRPVSARWEAGGGFLYSNDFGVPRWLPAVSLTYTKHDARSRWNIRLPMMVEYWYRTSPRTEVGGLARLEGNNFHINRNGPLHDTSVKYSFVKVGPMVETAIGKSLHVRVDAGAAVARRFSILDGKDEKLDLDPENAMYLELSARLQF